jgi:hypothetical protein
MYCLRAVAAVEKKSKSAYALINTLTTVLRIIVHKPMLCSPLTSWERCRWMSDHFACVNRCVQRALRTMLTRSGLTSDSRSWIRNGVVKHGEIWIIGAHQS